MELEWCNLDSTPTVNGRNRTWSWQDERILDEINNILPPELLNEWNKRYERCQTALWLRRESKFVKMRELEWKHDTPVGWISKRKNMNFTIRDDEWREHHHNASGRNIRMETKEQRRRQQVPPEMNLGEHPYKEGLNGVVRKSTTKRTCLFRAYGKYLKNLRWKPAINGNKIGLIWTRSQETYYTGRIKRKLGS